MDKLATHERVHIFLDEVNFVRDWAIEIKRIADGDKFDRVTVMCTGLPLGLEFTRMNSLAGDRREQVFPSTNQFQGFCNPVCH